MREAAVEEGIADPSLYSQRVETETWEKRVDPNTAKSYAYHILPDVICRFKKVTTSRAEHQYCNNFAFKCASSASPRFRQSSENATLIFDHTLRKVTLFTAIAS